MEKTYVSSTEEYLLHIPANNHTEAILKEVVHNLAYIADELADANRFNRELNGFCHMRFDEVGLKPEPDPKTEPQDDTKNCFICGKEIELKDGCYDDGGCIIDSHGNLTMACKDCANLFDAIISHDILGRKVRC